ncbi:uncharacterized protein O3C94_016444 [Discoglossus pictus]
MTKDKKMSERILNHIVEILSLLTGEVSCLQYLTDSLTVLDMSKDTQKTKVILNHTLAIIYLLTGEEYSIMKNDYPHSSIYQLTGECVLDGAKKSIVDEKLQTPRALGIQTNRSSGLRDKNADTPSAEGCDEMNEKDILQVTIQPEFGGGPSNVTPTAISRLEQEEFYMRGYQQVKEEEIPVNISEGLHDESLNTVLVIKEEENAVDNKDILQVTIHSDLCNDGFMDMNAIGQNHDSDEGINNIYHSSILVNTSSNGINSGVLNMTKEFACSDCGKCFSVQSNLIRHKKIHTGEKPFPCPECGKCFTEKSHFVVHQRIHFGEKPFVCSECGKCFTVQSNLVRHKKIHTGWKPFSCSECGKCFSERPHLINHQSVHTGEKPFSCSECGKCFSKKTDIIKHRRIHTGERPFACSECGKCFTQRSNLTTHQKVHTGEKPFTCSECGKCFTHKSHLITHQIVHTSEKPFSCYECGKCFSYKSTLTTHLRIHTEKKRNKRSINQEV